MTFSIIINNYNYGCFIKQAIDSALGQKYTLKEVIVVDDGSTDNSAEILQSYGSQIQAILKTNGGQASTYNTGFAKAKGELVLFLDSDDFLYPTCLESIAHSWNSTYSKAHFPLDIVNQDGKPLGKKIPRVLHAGDVRPLLQKFGHYSSPPASGNVYASSYLRQILPLPEQLWRGDADSIPITLAPLFGRILSINTTLAAHRVHRLGSSSSGTSGLNNPDYPKRLTSFIRREDLRYDALRHHAAKHNPPLLLPPFPLSPHLIRIKIECLLFHEQKNNLKQIGKLCFLGCHSSLTFPGYHLKDRVLLLLWFFLLFILPRPIAKTVILFFSK
jgi:glycosyltransferase involved in cell wall biosynthesis